MQELIDDILKGLNDEQKQAVTETEGYVRVVAGAGSGKTRVLTTRYVYIAKILGVEPSHILSVTFTNKAAKEMKRRVQRYMPDEDGGWILTIHGACNKILKEEIHRLHYPDNFLIMDEEDQKSVLKKIYEENGLTSKDFSYKHCLDAIGAYKGRCSYVPYFSDPTGQTSVPGLSRVDDKKSIDFVIKKYLELQRKNYFLDFDDLVFFTLEIFSQSDEAREKWQRRFEYIQVDEFQDVSKPEYTLIEILSLLNKNLFVVGDPDQTIYTWRGADIRLFLDFDKAFGGVKTIVLGKNYRSTPEILSVGNSLISHNTERIKKELVAVRKSGLKTRYFHARTRQEECEFIAAEIQNLQKEGASLGDIAVLYRSNYMSRPVEDAFLKYGIPYTIFSGVEYYRRKEIKDCIAYIRMFEFKDDLSFERIVNVPARGIGKKRMAAIAALSLSENISLYDAFSKLAATSLFENTGAKKLHNMIEEGSIRAKDPDVDISDLLDFALKKSGYEEYLMLCGDRDRLDNVTELKAAIKDFVDDAGEHVTLSEYLTAVALISNVDKKDKADSVKLMTVHTAKGLEFPYVFVCAMNEGLFPSIKIENKQQMEEERRVAYVAFTRAKDMLYLSDSDGFDLQTRGRLMPSRFIFNIDENLIEKSGVMTDEYVAMAKEYIRASEYALSHPALPDFRPYLGGDRVRHPVFGDGTVTSKANGSYVVKFDNGNIRTISESAGVLKPIK